jgi:hypothetical protein
MLLMGFLNLIFDCRMKKEFKILLIIAAVIFFGQSYGQTIRISPANNIKGNISSLLSLNYKSLPAKRCGFEKNSFALNTQPDSFLKNASFRDSKSINSSFTYSMPYHPLDSLAAGLAGVLLQMILQ